MKNKQAIVNFNTFKKPKSQQKKDIPNVSPLEFDEDYYLKNNPDVATAKIDPYCHYVNYGKAEGRKGCIYNLYKNITPLCETKETLLLVSHEASRTGAPILALNIAQELKKQLNVIILLLNDGVITSFFEENCNADAHPLMLSMAARIASITFVCFSMDFNCPSMLPMRFSGHCYNIWCLPLYFRLMSWASRRSTRSQCL